jgi:hypothetical protein
MLVVQQRQGANALENVVSAPVSGRGVMDRRTGNDGKTAAVAHPTLCLHDKPFVGHLVEAAGKELGQSRIGTHGKEPLAEVRQELPLQRLALLRRN